MHLLAATPGQALDGSEAVDLGQTPGDIVYLTAADTEISCLAAAQQLRCEEDVTAPSLRLANLMHLGHNYSVDLYIETVLSRARLIVVRLLGGRGYWPYGVDQICALARERRIAVAVLPGDDQPDPELTDLSTVDREASHRLWQYGVQGGIANALNLLRYADALLGRSTEWREPATLLRAGIYWPGREDPPLETLPWTPDAPVAAITFYRALVQAGNTAVIDLLITALQEEGLNPLPIYAASLKDPVAAATLGRILESAPPAVILNGTGFAVSTPGQARSQTPFDEADCPVLQLVFSGGDRQGWDEGTAGLSPRDIAMNVALPEVDGRILARAVSFKGAVRRDSRTEADIVTYQPEAERCHFAARLARNWVALRTTPPPARRIALVMANYPNRDGRLGNGVGLDTPASTVTLLRSLAEAGYETGTLPTDGAALIRDLAAGPTNAATLDRVIRAVLPIEAYRSHFERLPDVVRQAVEARWGPAESDPFYLESQGGFAVAVLKYGNAVVGLQPARGYNIDPQSTYHDPDLVPPHGYFAFYFWLRSEHRAHAVIHMGKHGNLEWLPGKAVALSAACYPEAVLGPMPHLYPFIVNDPGEGTQAKRRSQAVVIDHLTPPLARAESYGPLRDLEQLVDEYYEASSVDPRRLKVLGREILSLAATTGLDRDCGITRDDEQGAALGKLDAYLCELKEMQIRDGLHVLGEAPQGALRTDLLLALTRVPRGTGVDGDASLTRALAADFGLDFDPLTADPAEPWPGPRPAPLMGVISDTWRTAADTVERLELYARALVAGEAALPSHCSAAGRVLLAMEETLAPALDACGDAETNGVLTGLDGRFVVPGPSGAPTRGRPDVLPTGRNFYSVDTRTVPTPAAWTLGWKSAQLLAETYAQSHGDWPRRLLVTAWGTSNMRTGGDDIAQTLALMGVRPTWDAASRRVTGYEVLPLSVLDRPRIDVTLRVSGFFRDAFPGLIDLVDSAARAVAALDEPADENPLAADVRQETAALVETGTDEADARHRAGARVFGAKPGAYGAGLQALIDERGWQNDGDLARAYVAWGGYAYGSGSVGAAQHAVFQRRLAGADLVVQNQDNREHDLLDSDDYYQFEGGAVAAIRYFAGRQPEVFHNDHSLPENPRIRTLKEEISRVVRARAVNPKWIAGVMRHGYKGAFEIAATVDYLFAFAATARCVDDHHFDAVFEAYLADGDVRAFIGENNPAALREIAERFQEAIARDLWRPRRNDVHTTLRELAGAPTHDADAEPQPSTDANHPTSATIGG